MDTAVKKDVSVEMGCFYVCDDGGKLLRIVAFVGKLLQ